MSQIKALSIEEALSQSGRFVWIDVRSESEYSRAHIPGAVNLPLLNDEERAAVGTTYKHEGREAAVQLGLRLIGPKFETYYVELLALVKSSEKKPLLYCWRGGLRSQIASTLIQWSGLHAHMIFGGYRSFRQWVFPTLAQPRNYIVISGHTGTGKTEILHLLREQNSQVVDLEGLANHKGSALGALGLPPQPKNEHFENLVAMSLFQCQTQAPVFVENESRMIGKCAIPQGLWDAMQLAKHIELDVVRETRIERIMGEYGGFPINDLIEQTQKLRKRLGGQHEQAAIEALKNGDIKRWIEILLVYYDKSYRHFLEKNEIPIQKMTWDWNQKESSLLHLLSLSNHGITS
jgi:tRNA 2-selenouridine synthase